MFNPQDVDLYRKGAETLVLNCANLQAGEQAILIADPDTAAAGAFICEYAASKGLVIEQVNVPSVGMHGMEPPAEVAEKMCKAEVIFGLRKMSMAHTKARLAASERGARYLSLPDYSFAVLASPALYVDFRALSKQANHLANILTAGKKAHLTTQAGTDLHLVLEGRVANSAPGWCYEKGILASPPDAEVNIPPVEHLTEGVIVVDGSIPCRELGLLLSPLKLFVEKGRVVKIEGEKADILNQIFDRLNNPATRVIAEFGIGLNPKAALSGNMLEDEGCLGTAHLGIGSNKTIGGQNDVPFHLDHIVRHTSIKIDNHLLMKDGVLQVG